MNNHPRQPYWMPAGPTPRFNGPRGHHYYPGARPNFYGPSFQHQQRFPVQVAANYTPYNRFGHPAMHQHQPFHSAQAYGMPGHYGPPRFPSVNGWDHQPGIYGPRWAPPNYGNVPSPEQHFIYMPYVPHTYYVPITIQIPVETVEYAQVPLEDFQHALNELPDGGNESNSEIEVEEDIPSEEDENEAEEEEEEEDENEEEMPSEEDENEAEEAQGSQEFSSSDSSSSYDNLELGLKYRRVECSPSHSHAERIMWENTGEGSLSHSPSVVFEPDSDSSSLDHSELRNNWKHTDGDFTATGESDWDGSVQEEEEEALYNYGTSEKQTTTDDETDSELVWRLMRYAQIRSSGDGVSEQEQTKGGPIRNVDTPKFIEWSSSEGEYEVGGEDAAGGYYEELNNSSETDSIDEQPPKKRFNNNLGIGLPMNYPEDDTPTHPDIPPRPTPFPLFPDQPPPKPKGPAPHGCFVQDDLRKKERVTVEAEETDDAIVIVVTVKKIKGDKYVVQKQ